MSLFAGLGGFDLAAEWMGWHTVVLVEKDKQRLKWLKQLYPYAAQHDDIDTFDNRPYRGNIDIIYGGEPCQGNSVAGDRKGINDPRYKWPSFLQQVDEVEPLWLVNENVRGSISNGILDRKISDLESIGYACWPPLLIPAGAVGTHHKRERIYLVAYSLRERRQERNPAALSIEQPQGAIRNITQRPASFRSVARYADKSEILRAADGLSSGLSAAERNKAIESYGNAVVPQVVYHLFQAIQQADQQ